MQVDLEDDRFDVTYSPKELSSDTLLEAVRKLEYKPELVTRTEGGGEKPSDQVDAAQLPKELAALFAKARETNKVVLLKFSGPG